LALGPAPRPHRGHRCLQRGPRPDLPGPRLLRPGDLNMAVADELERSRAALRMINPAPYNAEAPPEALAGEITPVGLHYVRSNFALPTHDGTLEVGGAV